MKQTDSTGLMIVVVLAALFMAVITYSVSIVFTLIFLLLAGMYFYLIVRQ